MKQPGKNALYAEEDAGNYVQVLPEAYAETDLKALWKNIAQKSEGRVKKRRFFSCALCCSIFILGSIRLGIRHFGLREVFCGCGSILVCWKALAGMKFGRRNHPELLKSSGR